ncbi:MAG: hypothetical protein SFW35_01190 [Chitinophagales bacterium]|nr:hypothetical protein [Chitinophagales bacterium]
MQISMATIEKVRLGLRAAYPGEYAFRIISRLRKRGIKISKQEIYNCFCGLPVKRENLIVNTAIELLHDHKSEQDLKKSSK